MTKIFSFTSTLLLGSLFFAAQSCKQEDAESYVQNPSGSSGGKTSSQPSLGSGAAGSAGNGSGSATGTGNTGNGGSGGRPGTDEPAPAPGCTELKGLDECGATSVEATFTPANVLLVIDKSGSMDDQPNGFDTNKWFALKSALAESFGNATDQMSLGLLLYPFTEDGPVPLDCTDNCCALDPGSSAVNVPIESATTSLPKIMGALQATSPGGGTPTAAALGSALSYFTTGAGANLDGKKFVVLATDGGPNCNAATACDANHCTHNLDGKCEAGNCCDGEPAACVDDGAVLQQIGALKAAGVKTFVVGIPGTEKYASFLSSFADAGGVPSSTQAKYYAVAASGGVKSLSQTFTDITTHLIRSCDVELSKGVTQRRLINVAVDCEVVPYADGVGWNIDASGTKLTLQGDTCGAIETNGAQRIDIVYGCPTLR